jgi:DNA modification methylase
VNSFVSFEQKAAAIGWDFPNVENRGIHLVHWYPATFVSAIPGSLIPLVSHPGDFIVDPFCGGGATIVEAVRLGRAALGFDVNPVALLVSSAKVALPSERSFSSLHASVEKIRSDLSLGRLVHQAQNGSHPNAGELLKWYQANTYEELLRIQQVVESLRDTAAKIVGRCVFSSILKNVCSQGRHWGWVCDNVRPKPEELLYKDAVGTYLSALDAFSDAVGELRSDMSRRGLNPQTVSRPLSWDVRRGDANANLSALPEKSVDVILTSPPYYGVADYVKSQRLTFLWYHPSVARLEGFEKEFEELRTEEIGSRSHRHRKSSLDDYVSYMTNFIREAARVLKPSGKLCLVLGESHTRMPTTSRIMQSAADQGLRLAFASDRDIRATRRRIVGSVPHESILICVRHDK